ETINAGKWYVSTTTGISYNGTDKGIAFASNAPATGRVTAQSRVNNLGNCGLERVFTAEASLKISGLASGAKFGFVYALPSLNSALLNSSGPVFVYFSASGGNLYCGVSKYASGSETVVKAAANTGLVATGNVQLSVISYTNGGLSVKVNNAVTVFDDQTAGLEGAGFFGFAQTATGNTVTITAVEVKAFVNSTPTNSNFYADFSGSSYNLNELHTVAKRDAAGLSWLKPVDEKLVFRNTTNAFVSTRRVYSNFEIEIEVVDLQREAVFDANMELVSSISTGFGIAAGAANYDATIREDIKINFYPDGGSPTRMPSSTRVDLLKGRDVKVSAELPLDYHFWNERIAAGRGVFIKVSMTDGRLLVMLRYRGDASYYTAIDYDNGYVADGYLQVISLVKDASRGRCDNFALNSVNIRNTDPFTTQIITIPVKDSAPIANFPYVDYWDNNDMLFYGQ
ncbi:MAG: hypothetical protein FWE62_06520, partial [Firmicutes bacterium]|nr:hypothetical protein [Bacillota bacterium]